MSKQVTGPYIHSIIASLIESGIVYLGDTLLENLTTRGNLVGKESHASQKVNMAVCNRGREEVINAGMS